MPNLNIKINYFNGIKFALKYGLICALIYCIVSLIGTIATLITFCTVIFIFKGWMKGATAIDRKSYWILIVLIVVLVIFSFIAGIYTQIIKETISGIMNGTYQNTFGVWFLSFNRMYVYMISDSFLWDQWLNMLLISLFTILTSYPTLSKLNKLLKEYENRIKLNIQEPQLYNSQSELSVNLVNSNIQEPKPNHSQIELRANSIQTKINEPGQIDSNSSNDDSKRVAQKSNSQAGVKAISIIVMFIFVFVFRAITSSIWPDTNSSTPLNTNSTNPISSLLENYSNYSKSAASSKAKSIATAEEFLKSQELATIETELTQKFQLYFDRNKVLPNSNIFSWVDVDNNIVNILCNIDSISKDENGKQQCKANKDLDTKYTLGTTKQAFYKFEFVNVNKADFSDCSQSSTYLFKIGVLNQDGVISLKHCKSSLISL